MTLLFDEEPIAALASGKGPSAIAVIRLSGKGIFSLLSPLLHRTNSRGTVSKNSSFVFDKSCERNMICLDFVDPTTKEIVDQILGVCFFAPHSYTGQDSAELHCHGSPYIINRILSSLYANGFRAADPGEYTRRAFLNHKMDLTKAEGIKALIEAESYQEWFAAAHLFSGKLEHRINDLRGRLLSSLALLEARIDFPDEGDTSELSLHQVKDKVNEVLRSISQLSKSFDSGRIASKGLSVAIFGSPNVGKSTLLNTLLGEERAIVTPIAGTTRDYLEESCLLEGRLVKLIDMAGFREHPDSIEKIGIDRAFQLIKESDITLLMTSFDQEYPELKTLVKTCLKMKPKKLLMIVNKVDLKCGKGFKELPLEFPEIFSTRIELSCKSRLGLDLLKSKLISFVDSHVSSLKEESFITSARHQAALIESKKFLERFLENESHQVYDECLAIDLREAAKSLTSIIGEISTDDILDKIFGQFCIGK